MLSIIQNLVYQSNVNFTAFPQQLNTHLMLNSLWLAELLATIIVILICCVPFAFMKSPFLVVMGFYLSISFCTAIGWLDSWFIIFLTMVTAGFYSMGMLKNLLGG